MNNLARIAPRPGERATVGSKPASPATPRPAGGGSSVADTDSSEVVAAAPHEDGRHARRDRNKYAVVDAFLDLVREGNSRPSIAAVADRSGVSHRSVFRYFSDKDELVRTAIERQLAVAAPLVPLTVGPGAPLVERIERFVERRLELFAVIAPVARLARSLASRQPILAEQLRTNRAFFRAQIRHLFRPELDALDADGRQRTLSSLDALCSLESADLMELDQDLTAADIAATMRWAIAKVLSP